MKHPDSRSRERGQAMVESALILLIFLFTLISIIDFGQLLFFHQALTERVRNAARYGALHFDRGCDQNCVANLVVYNSTAAGGRVSIPGLTTANVAVTMPDTSYDARVTVSIVNYRLRVFSPFFGRTSLVIKPILASTPIEAPN